MFLTLVATTLLFSHAKVNGALDKVTKLTVKSVRGKATHISIGALCIANAAASENPARHCFT
jgi:hypothetical protein